MTKLSAWAITNNLPVQGARQGCLDKFFDSLGFDETADPASLIRCGSVALCLSNEVRLNMQAWGFRVKKFVVFANILESIRLSKGVLTLARIAGSSSVTPGRIGPVLEKVIDYFRGLNVFPDESVEVFFCGTAPTAEFEQGKIIFPQGTNAYVISIFMHYLRSYFGLAKIGVDVRPAHAQAPRNPARRPQETSVTRKPQPASVVIRTTDPESSRLKPTQPASRKPQPPAASAIPVPIPPRPSSQTAAWDQDTENDEECEAGDHFLDAEPTPDEQEHYLEDYLPAATSSTDPTPAQAAKSSRRPRKG